MREHYIDNLRWGVILLLIPFHAAQAFKIWDEPNYIVFGPNPALSSIIVFFGPFVMQLLFLFAGMSIRYALKRRTCAQFVAERIKRLFIPLVFGVLVLVPPMCYLADRFHNGYSGSFFEHYKKFFTVITDMSGADGGFSFGQFWFLLYLFLLSLVLLGIIVVQKRIVASRPSSKKEAGSSLASKGILFWGILCLGLPLPLFSELLSVGGKSFVEFFYFLLLGYYVFTNEAVTEKLRKHGALLLAIGVAFGVTRVILFVYCGVESDVVNTVVTYLFEWFMVIGLFGAGGRFFNHENAVTRYLTAISYPFFSFHFLFVILFQYLFSDILRGSTLLLYMVPVLLSYAATILCCEITRRIPVLCFLVGIKSKKG